MGQHNRKIQFYKSSAKEASAVLKSSQGRLLGFCGFNFANDDRYIQVHDAASLPADLSICDGTEIKVPANSHFSFSGIHPDVGLQFDDGIVVVISTTPDFLTIDTEDNAKFQAAWV